MNELKKDVLGQYHARDVDRLLLKVRSDYENCLKEQKERIVKLREENREMCAQIEKYKSNERLILGAITRAEEAAQEIIGSADKKAKERLASAEEEEKQIRTAIEAATERLYKLRRASEAICHAIARTMGEYTEPASGAIRTVISLYDGMH